MEYYEVWVRSQRYQQRAALTYSSVQSIAVGSVVSVPLQRQQVLAIVKRQVAQPTFACKPISEIHHIPPLPEQTVELFRWLQAYYPAPVGPTANLFLPSTLSATEQATTPPSQPPPKIDLNQDQRAAVTQMHDSGTYLLHGRTGSGKTRVYAALAAEQLNVGKSVMILSPEISLTPQLIGQLQKLLGRECILLHSKLTAKQRSLAWQQIANQTSEPIVVIGPRSALFAPIHNLGLIVLDEVHEPAYKQEQQPYYYAPRVAAKLASLHNAVLVLGSATPPVSEYYLALQKQRPIIHLDKLATTNATKVETTVVDVKDRSLFSSRSQHLSSTLLEALSHALARGEQSMLYLNRRGTARLSLCNNCGWQANCMHCEIPLTYHADSHQLLCHTCGRHQDSHTACPECGNPDIVLRTAGTKAIAEDVQRLFPEARVMRFDTDNLKAERFETHFEAVMRGEVDILVGTQLLAKGLDLPKLTTLGIVLADSSLSIPDFTAEERTYQLIQQVLGRVGRGHTKSARTIIQTYNPESPVIQSAIASDWEGFYAQQIEQRKQFDFPPFCHLLKLQCRRKSVSSAERAATKLAKELTGTYGSSVTVDGPTPAFHEKSGGYYYWQLILKSSNRSTLIKALELLPSSGWSYDIDPINLL